MAGITLADAEAQLTTWLAANTKVASGQGYTIGTRTLTRADASEILQQVEFWDAKVKALSRGTTAGRVRLGTPIP